MQYNVRALTVDHSITELTLHGADEADIRRQLEERGLFASTITPARYTWRSGLSRANQKNSGWSLVLFSVEVLALLRAGLNIVECLEALSEKDTSATMRPVISQLLNDLREGKRFSAALATQPECFPPLYVAIIESAEGTGDLPKSLARFIEYQKRIDEVRSKIVTASIYPLILFVVGSGVTLFLIGYVVPRFALVYESTGKDLPWLSQMLMEWGRIVGGHAVFLLSAFAIVLVSSYFLSRYLLQRFGLVVLLRLLPNVAWKIRLVQLSRFYLTLGMLLEGGIPIIPAMASAIGVVSPSLRTGIRSATENIRCGAPVSTAFKDAQLTTPVSLRLLRVGEKSGELGQMMSRTATLFDEELGRWIERFTRSFEPLLMAAIGLLVGLILVLLYIPFFDLAEGFV